MSDPAGTVRYNADTGMAYVMTGRGWKQYSGDEALTLREAAEGGITGALMTGLVDTLTLGLVNTDAMQKTREAFPYSSQAVPAAEIGLGIGAVTRGLARPAAQAARRQVTGTVAERTQAQIAGNAAQAGARGFDSAGAASTLDEFATNQPGWLGRARDRVLAEFAGDPQDLTTAQRRFLESGTRERIGFQLLPGQERGRNLLSEMAKRDPFIAGAFDDVFRTNYETGNRIATRALGLDESVEFGFDELGQAADTIGEGIERVIASIGTTKLDEAARRAVDDVLTESPAARNLLRIRGYGEEIGEEVGGDTLTSLRSILNDLSRSKWNQGLDVEAQVVDAAIDQIDEIIERAIGAEGRMQYKELREQWKLLKLFERSGSVRADGTINWESLATAGKFRKEFKGAFGRSDTDRGTSLSQATRDLLDFTRAASVFKANVADSGTATAIGFQDALTNPQGLAARFLIRGYLKREADRLNDFGGAAGAG